MISCSHWGTFSADAIDHLAPRGFKFADHLASEWKRADGLIPCEHVKSLKRWANIKGSWVQLSTVVS